jgi:glycosyltransferase involved in cell wall biosynthesis
MSRPPRVSVVVPSYQNADFIAETVDSVLAQTYDDFELVVSDHSSDDGTWEILQRYAANPRVRLFREPSGGGAPRNWNSVTARARGELVKLVCGDDLLTPDCLEVQVAAFDAAGPGVTMVAARRDVVDATGRPVVRGRGLPGLHGRVVGGEAVRATVRAGTNIFGEPCCVLIRRRTLEQIGGWHGTDGYVIDLATYVRLLMLGDLVCVPRSLSAFRVSAGQWSVRLARVQTRQNLALHDRVSVLAPELLRGSDLLVGRAMTRLRTAQRRAAYVVLSRRLRSGTPATRRAGTLGGAAAQPTPAEV